MTDRVVRVFSTALILVIVLRSAWIVDDALITLRSALNITHGFGPGFNGTEAVQAYTHPLWFLIWVGIGSLTDQWILGILLFSVVVATVAIVVLVWRARSLAQVVLVIGFFLLSNALVDYSTSGLEGPLGWLFIAALIALTQQWITRGPQVPLLVPALTGLSAAGLLLTRLDLALLAAPAILWVLWKSRPSLKSVGIFLGSVVVPMLAWTVWSWTTYATLLPNTFLAKRNVDIPATELVVQGIRYVWVSLQNDPGSLVLLIVGLTLGVLSRESVLRAWSIGALIYLAYVLYIGGDFMAGRFLTPSLYVALSMIALVTILGTAPSRRDQAVSVIGAMAVIGLLVVVTLATNTRPSSLNPPTAVRWETGQNINAGVDDARGGAVAQGKDLQSYLDQLSLAYTNPDFVPVGNREGLNRSLREISKAAQNWPINDGWFTTPSEVSTWCGFLGNVGIATGPTVHLLDDCALTDRFLAERSFVPAEPFAWKMGHFHRSVPEGYTDALLFDDPTRMVDPADAFYLEELWNTIRADYS